jgi:hypothetical protein
MPETALTPPQLARLWGCKPDTIRALIDSSQLRAVNIAKKPGGRPRWRITPSAICEFENARAAKPKVLPARRRRKKQADVINFF